MKMYGLFSSVLKGGLVILYKFFSILSMAFALSEHVFISFPIRVLLNLV